MKIPNKAVYFLVACYAVLGFFAFPFNIYLWQWLNLVVVLVFGMLFNAAGVLGAGDAKFMAGAAPMVMVADIRLVLVLFAASLLGGLVAHRLAKHSPIRQLTPNWQSWEEGRRFPMGFPLSVLLVIYLVVVAIYR